MVKRDVIWTKTADLQLVGVLEYWVNRNKSTSFSKKLVRLVSKRTKEISEQPFIYKSIDFKEIRVASLVNFNIYYKITDSQIIIMAFWDNRQDPKKLLKLLKNQS
ncbi:type II toxin-antitoxin system RelE/ParE family toxin [Algoriphagus halophilus]|uniref:type II toxin-antitoxin system RelE/ParE family toxin n=1 Tax=Algoriphagus halophilus TaxID=226505 RepID=UPI00358F916D